MEVAKVWNTPTAEQMQKALQNYNGKMETFSDFENMIKNAITEMLSKALEVKEGIKAKQIQEEAEKMVVNGIENRASQKQNIDYIRQREAITP